MTNVVIFTDRAPRLRYYGDKIYNMGYYNHPAGAYKIASSLREQGLDVLVVPNAINLSWNGVKRIINKNSAGLLWVGVSTTLMFGKLSAKLFNDYRENWHTNPNFTLDIVPYFIETDGGYWDVPWGIKEFSRIAEYCEQFNAPLLIGGSFVTRSGYRDWKGLHKNAKVVTGYAERYLNHFTRNKKNNPNHDPHYLVTNNSYDDVDFKQSKITWTDEDFASKEDWLPLEVARGCAFNCAYCSYDLKGTQEAYKNTTSLREEIIRNYEVYGITKYHLVDDLYNDSKTKVRRLYDEVWSKLPFKPEWVSYMRLDMFWADPESIEIVKESGARMGGFGIETLNDRAGKAVGKGLGKTRILEALHMLKERWQNQVLINAYFIAGLPYESKESIMETLEWCLNTDLLFSANWYPHWITPPSNFSWATEDAISKIARAPDDYGITWLDYEDNISWVNSEGVTYEDAENISMQYNRSTQLKKFIDVVSQRTYYTDYADIRACGITHDEIVNARYTDNSQDEIVVKLNGIEEKVQQRLKKLLQIS